MARASSTAVARRYERLRQYQRRAHARNREHLENLERTIRECEIEGMAMKTEAGNATRRAVEENRHLRDLLAQHGITQEYVDGYLASEAVTGQQPTNQTATQTLHFRFARGTQANAILMLSVVSSLWTFAAIEANLLQT